MATHAPNLLPQLWKSTLVSGVLALVLGVVILIWPGHSVIAAAILFGVYLLVSGAAQVIFAFALPIASAVGRVLLFLSGTASLILGVLCFRHFNSDTEALAVMLLAIWIAVGLIFRGVATTVTAISDPVLPERGWQIFSGVVTLLAGLVVLALPFSSMWIMAIMVGSWLIVLGVIEIVAGFRLRKATQTVAAALTGR